MAKPLFQVINPGLYATIQDKGRWGYQQYGVPVSGALDRYAHHMANYILGNKEDMATIEVTMFGTKLHVLSDHHIAITGADLNAMIDGVKAPLWQSFKVFEGQVIHFQQPLQGARAYVAVLGGVERELILGSRSTFARGKIYDVLQKGERIDARDEFKMTRSRKLIPTCIPTYKEEIELRVIPSHHETSFEEKSLASFYEQTYRFKNGDRMGYMILGDHALVHQHNVDIISECTTFGTIQVPPSGQPIILLADSQTTGGYPTIGTIVSDDLWKVAQLLPKGTITFKRAEFT